MANTLLTDDANDEAPAPESEPDQAPAVAGKPPTFTADDYDAGIALAAGAKQQQLRTATIQADDVNPDRAADIQKLSSSSGIPPEVVERNYDAIKKNERLRSAPIQQMQQDTPHLATWAADPANAKVSSDDMEKLGALEWLVTMPQRAVAQTLNEQKYGALRTKSLFGPLTQDEQDQLDSAKYAATLGGKLGAGDSWFKNGIVGALKLFTFVGSAQPFAAIGAAGGGLVGAAAGSVIPGAGTLAGAAEGASLGYEAGTAFGLGKVAFETGAGPAYDDFLGMKDELGNPLNPSVARAAALAVGVINAGMMGLTGETAMKAAGLDKLTGRFTQSAVAAALRQPGIRAALADAMKGYGAHLTEGTALMVGQTAVSIMGRELAKASSGQPFQTPAAADVAGELGTSAASALKTFGVAGLVGMPRAIAADVQRAQRAQAAPAFFNALGEGIANSKTAERLPDAARSLIEAATKDGPIPTVYAPIDTWQTYWQGKGIDPAEMAARVTGSSTAYQDAARTGGDLAIPTGRYASTLAGTQHNAFFSNELRLGPDEMNGRESAALAENLQGILEAQQPAQESPIRASILAELTKNGKVAPATAEHYADLIDAGFGSMAERAGVDPAELYESYGLKVERPDVPDAEGLETPRAAGEVAPDATPLSPSEPAAEELPLARPGDTRSVDLKALDASIIAKRPRAGSPGDVPDNPVAQRLEAERLDLQRQAAENPERFFNAGRSETAEPASSGPDASAREGDIVPGRPGEQPVADQGRRAETAGDESGAQPRRIPTVPEYGETFARRPLEDTTARLTPGVRAELERVLEELDTFPFTERTWHWLGASEKKTGNAGGGDADIIPGAAGTPVYDDIKYFSPYNKNSKTGEAAKEVRGSRGDVKAAIRKVLETGDVHNNLAEGALRVAELRDAGDYKDLSAPWLPPIKGVEVPRAFTDELSRQIDEGLRPEGNMLDDAGLENDALEHGDDGDTSFNINEFSQSLFDDLEPPDPTADTLASPKADLLDTGEAQSRLPGDVGDVREGERPTPEFEAPFSLTSEVAQPRGKQTTLFQSEPAELTPENVKAWSDSVMARVGPDLKGFDVRLTAQGDLQLDLLAVDRGAQRAGVGSSVMKELTRFADLNGRRITLALAEKGYSPYPGVKTSSTSRLVKFYKRFGFQENAGRSRDFTTRADMIREPNVLELGQPLYHGSPHDFDRFSTEKIGTGEGAAAYGWGLYFAENPQVAAGYHESLSRGGQLTELRLGSLRAGEANSFDYSKRAHESDLENIRASLAEDLIIDAGRLKAEDPQQAALKMLDQKIADYRTEWPEGAIAGERLRKELEKPGAVSATFDQVGGGVYKVDIPDEHIARMLDYDAPLKDQPDNVKAALEKIDPDHWKLGGDDYDAEEKGDSIYNRIVAITEKKTADGIVAEMKALEAKQFSYDYSAPARELLMSAAPPEDYARWKELDRQLDTINREAPKNASLALLEAGVPGLRYFDQGSRDEGKGTRNVVAFDDAIVKLTHKNGQELTPAERAEYFQGDRAPEGRRGAIRFGPDRQFSIALMERADLSTFLHETGHLFLEVFGDIADKLQAVDPAELTPSQKQLLGDYGATLTALGVDSRAAIGVAEHENFAKLFEHYLGEGKAPTVALGTAFARFRAWLTGVYRSLTKLNVKLTPEVRGVMDRLLASDQAIQDAEAQRGVEPMFTTPESAQMTPAGFELYRQAIADAGKTARERLDAKLMNEVHREQTRAWKAQRADVQTEVEADVHARPEYEALAAMRRGTRADGSDIVEGMTTDPMRLSRAILVDRFGPERVRRLPRDIVSSEGGIDPDLVATAFHYDSADAMLTAVEKAPPMRDVIKQETARRMIDEHGSMLLDGSLQEHAAAAIANEDRDTIIRAEMRALGRLKRTVDPHVQAERASGRLNLEAEQAERDYERRWLEAETKLRIAMAEGHKQVEIDKLVKDVRELKAKARGGAAVIRGAIPDEATLKAAADARITSMVVGDIKPATFWSAARRAGQLAVERAARQDFDGAISAKQQELINLALFRRADAAIDDIQDRVEFARGLTKPAARKVFGLAGQSYLDQVDGILDRFEFATVSKKVLARRGDIRKFVEGLQAQGLPVDLPDAILDESNRRNYKEMTVDELTGITDGLKELQHVARLKFRLLRQGEKRDLDTLAKAAGDSIRENAMPGRAPEVSRDRSTGGTARLVRNFFGSMVRLGDDMRELDGGKDGGPMWDAISRPLNEAGADEAARTADATRRLGALVEDAYPLGEKRKLYEKYLVPEIGRSLSKMERLMIALNSGNDGNKEVLMKSEGWKPDQVQAVLETLDARDLKFVQGVLDLVNSYKPDIAAKQRRVYGVEPTWVDPTSITTRAGEIPGGYFPLKYDDRLSAKAARGVDLEAGNLAIQAAYVQATTNRGHLKDRQTGVGLPIRRDFGVIYEHIGQVIHDLTHHEALIDIGRVLAHSSVQKAIYDTAGDQVYKRIKASIRDVAFGAAGATQGFEQAMGYLRSGTSIAGLGWSLTAPLLHLSGALPKAFARVGPEWIAKGMVHYMRDAVSMESSAEWINSMSPMMESRGRTQQRELAEIRSSVGADTGRFSGYVAEVLDKSTFGLVDKQKIADSYFYLVAKSQQMADVPTWLGQWEKSKAGGETDERAAAIADQAVLDAFGGGQLKDLPAVMRGGALLKVWTTFYGPFNSAYNLLRSSVRGASLGDAGSIGRLAADFVLLSTVPAAMGYGIRSAFRGGPAEKHGWDDAVHVATEFGRAHLAYLADMMVGTRELAGLIEGHDYQGPAGAHIFADIGQLFSQGGKTVKKLELGHGAEALDASFWHSLAEVSGVLFHFPAAQLARTTGGLMAIAEGKTSNPVAAIAGPPREAK